jgi:hypothetical protein
MRTFALILLATLIALGGSFDARAGRMDTFVDNVFNWRVGERPKLIMSLGTVMVWVRDPTDSLPIDSPEQFYNARATRTLVLLPPGSMLIVFPPRRPENWRSFLGFLGKGTPPEGRLKSERYMLAVSEQGLWGVFDAQGGNQNLFVDEPVLQCLAGEEMRDGVAGLGVVAASALNPELTTAGGTPLPIGLSRGEMVRVLDDSGQSLTVDANGACNPLKSTGAKIAGWAKQNNVTPPAKFSLPSDKSQVATAHIVDTFVNRNDVAAWQTGKDEDGFFSYENKIFNRSFASVRIPNSDPLEVRCNDTTETTSKTSSDFTSKAGAALGIDAPLLRVATGSLKTSFDATFARVTSTSDTSKDVAHNAEELRLVEYRQANNQSSAFWIGRARTCESRAGNWYSLVTVWNGAQDFLHAELGDPFTSGQPEAAATVFEKEAARIDGGSPFNTRSGSLTPVCFKQLVNFDAVVQQFEDPQRLPRMRAALLTRMASGTFEGSLNNFFSLKCALGTS